MRFDRFCGIGDSGQKKVYRLLVSFVLVEESFYDSCGFGQQLFKSKPVPVLTSAGVQRKEPFLAGFFKLDTL